MAKPLRIEWDVYEQGTTPATELILWRNENGGPFAPIVTFMDLSITSYIDRNLKHNRTYCYELRAVTPTKVASLPSNRACARPRK